MEKLTVVVLDHEGMAHAMPLLLAINSQALKLDIEYILLTDSEDKAILEMKGKKKIRKILVPAGQLHTASSLNLAAHFANGEIVAFVRGGLRPITKTWPLGVIDCFDGPLIAGACSFVISDSSSSLASQLHNHVSYLGGMLLGKKRFDALPVPGFVPDNMAIRRAYWQLQKFDEDLDLGKSVEKWATGCFAKGLDIVGNWAFAVSYDEGDDLLEELTVSAQSEHRPMKAMRAAVPRPRRLL